MMAERNARSRALMKVASVCMIAAASVFALVELVPLIVTMILLGQSVDASSVGIIGGADGPTAIFVTSPDWTEFLICAVIVAALLAVGIVLLKKTRRS